MVENNLCYRIDTGDDRRISKDEFTSDALKGLLEKVTIITKTSYININIRLRLKSVNRHILGIALSIQIKTFLSCENATAV